MIMTVLQKGQRNEEQGSCMGFDFARNLKYRSDNLKAVKYRLLSQVGFLCLKMLLWQMIISIGKFTKIKSNGIDETCNF